MAFTPLPAPSDILPKGSSRHPRFRAVTGSLAHSRNSGKDKSRGTRVAGPHRQALDDPSHENMDPEREVHDDLATLLAFSGRFDEYSDEEVELSDEEIEELEQLNFQNILETALSDRELVDYERLKAVLGHRSLLEHLSAARRNEIAKVLIANMEHLYPIADEIRRSFQTFSGGPKKIQRQIALALLKSIQSYRGKWPPDYHMVWILNVFASANDWGGATEILAIFKNHPSDVVRRFAALALHATGSRADAMALRTEYAHSSPLTRLAILLASRKLGHDERQHWRQTLQLTRILERKL